MKSKSYAKLFENFLISEKFENERFNTFKNAHPVGSKFVKVWLAANFGKTEICKITEYMDGDPTDDAFVKSKNVVYTNSKGEEIKVNHNELYNREDERADRSSSGWIIFWKN